MRNLLIRFRKAKEGLAAVEFALLLPVMATLFFGVVEVSMALGCRADVANVASTVADLVAQESTMTTADMTNVFSAANAILYPNSITPAKITVSSIVYNTTTQSLTSGTVAWSCTQGGTARTTNSSVSLPSGLMTANGSVIMSEITYSYQSVTMKILTSPIAMSNVFYTKPRRVSTISAPPSCS